MDGRSLARLLIAGMVFLMAVQIVSAATSEPESPDTITVRGSGRQALAAAETLEAEAGNVTAMAITHDQVTRYWQGYFGNISGDIVLDDADSNTLFKWTLANPSGEVFAVNTSASVSWANITCVNFTGNTSCLAGNCFGGDRINLSNIDVQYGITNHTTVDGFNFTFNTTFSGTLQIGQVVIDGTDDNCHQAYTFVNEAWQSNVFKEVLLFDNLSALVFTSILEDTANGYQAGTDDTHDFQMLVGENGNATSDTTTTTYWFYVELN